MANLNHGGTSVTTAASWEATVTQNKKSAKYHFETSGKYVDQDIDLKVDVKTTSASKTSLGYGASVTIPEGWIDETTISNGVTAGSIDKTSIGYGEKATVNAGYIATKTEITNSIGAGTVTAGSGTITASVSGTKNASGQYPITGTAFEPTVTVGTAGYVSSTVGTKNKGSVGVSGSVEESTLSATSITPGAEQTVTIGKGYYPSQRTVTIKATSEGTGAVVAASATDPGTAYTSKKITLASGGYLKIDSGYIPNTKISLADLVPDEADIVAEESSPYILTGHSAYDNDGKLITGGINNGTITNNTSGGTSAATINRGKQIKIGAGYYGSDVYYTAQSNSGTVTISKQTGTSVDGYATANVSSGSASVTGKNFTPTVSIGTLDTTTQKYTISATGSTTVAGSATAGWVTSVSSATVGLTGGSITMNHAGAPTAALTSSSDTAKYPSGYSALTITSKAGYNHEAVDGTINVYQGVFTVE